ncbi:nucleotidyltransferase domain-containing protein [Candidatus Sumerlaeota bacterium]|nr:nucleotidyltransferase domain-containing protein [Candidatus Sumerlaeota bacterium]MBI3736426.1 nucleotidyltransferase domain-containing protein [Candidatus Sumerlaeota bacterium]
MISIEKEFPADQVAAICHRYRVRELALFGSALGEKFKSESDFDLLVEFQPDAHIGLIELGALRRELSVLAHHDIDLVPKRGLKPSIRDSVLSGSKVIYAA